MHKRISVTQQPSLYEYVLVWGFHAYPNLGSSNFEIIYMWIYEQKPPQDEVYLAERWVPGLVLSSLDGIRFCG